MARELHKDHRKRVREEFLANGFSEATPPHKILEMLLFYSIPRADTNETAHLLLKQFGSFDKVIDAPVEELKKVNGVGENTAVLLKLIADVTRLYMKEKTDLGRKKFYSLDEVGDFLTTRYIGRTKETFAVTSFDNQGSMLGFDIIAEGEVGEVSISLRNLVETAIKRNAAYVILSHNHPGGQAVPSNRDIETTTKICEVLRNINIAVLDHIILCDNDYVSLLISDSYKHLFRMI